MTSNSQHLSNTQLYKYFVVAAWCLTLAVSVVGLLAWGQDHRWQLQTQNAYQIFPVLGILAYSIMWSQYVVGAVCEIYDIGASRLTKYFRYTGYCVLGLICLHPSILIAQRFLDGFGLPPKSYETYVAPGLGWITLLGTASLLVFLAHEFHRKYAKRSWWQYVQNAGDFAMLAIFYHGLKLGGQLNHRSWFRTVWIFYGLVLVVILLRKYSNNYLFKKTAIQKSLD